METTDRFAASTTEDGRYRLLVEAVTGYAIYMLDAAGNVSSWNAGAQRFKGYAANEILGQHFSRFYTDEDRLSGLPSRALATAAGEGRFENEGWRLRKDGTPFWAHVIIDPIFDEAGGVVGFAKVTRDLTERRENQKALDQAREALVQAQKMGVFEQARDRPDRAACCQNARRSAAGLPMVMEAAVAASASALVVLMVHLGSLFGPIVARRGSARRCQRSLPGLFQVLQ